MKKISICLLAILIFSFANAQQPKIEYFINDYADLLTYDQKAEIEPILKEIYDSGRAEYAIVIVDTLNGEDIEGYSYKLAEGNLGDREKNNGLLLLIAVEDRQYRFEVGRGLEPVLPDVLVGRIGRTYLTPYFQNNDYATGIKEASFAVKDILFNNTESIYYKETQQKSGLTEGIIIFIILVAIAIIIIVAAYKNTVPRKRKDEDYFFAGWILSELLKGGKGGGSGGFSGGGFGGFGGGSFGGGGAGSHW